MTGPKLKKAAKTAAPKGPSISARVANIDPDYVDCRDLQHSWRRVDAAINKGRREIRREMQCTRCPMQRTQILNFDWSVKSNSYRGPQDYYLKGGRMTSDERAALRRRTTDL